VNTLLIARFTLQEAVSRRLILAGVLISIGYIVLFALGFHFAYDKSLESTNSAETRLSLGVAFATLTLFGMYVVNYLASFLALFLSVGAISSEIDSGTLHAVLARPIRRSEFVLGRWIAYAGLLVVYVLGMAGAIFLIASSVARYDALDPARAAAYMALSAALLMTLSLFGSTWLSTLANGVVVFSLFGLAWLAGIIEFVGEALRNDAMVNLGIAVSLLVPSDGLWRAASYYVQSPLTAQMLAQGQAVMPFAALAPPAAPFVVWSAGYLGVCLVGAVLAFRARDL
jgi:ABC-type transport system involved in multi-copper enzyme maturation permease subunit